MSLAERFRAADSDFGPIPLWWWSGDTLSATRLARQIDLMLEQGIHAAVVINLAPRGPMYGTLADDPPFRSERWWRVFLEVARHARDSGFRLWIYDQIGFSGANLQGALVAKHPEFAGRKLERRVVRAGPDELSIADPGLVAAWVTDEGGTTHSLPISAGGVAVKPAAMVGELTICTSVAHGFDYFSEVAAVSLIDEALGEYVSRMGPLFEPVIGGVFQDELPAMPTWSPDFAERFRVLAGYDIAPCLPALFGQPLPLDQDVTAARVRFDFQRARTRFALDGFFGSLTRWLNARNLMLGFDQQSPAREGHPVGATALFGDYLATHAGFGAPGSDHWGDSKIHSSLAHLGQGRRVWLEAFHSSGWGGTLEETWDWLAPFFRRGATLINPHAVYYSMASGWFEWAAPSTCWRQPYWSDYRTFAEGISRLSELLSSGDHVAPLLLYFPTEQIQSQLRADGILVGEGETTEGYVALNGIPSWYAEERGALERTGVDYDILGGFALGAGTVEDGAIRIQGERFSTVILPPMDVLSESAARVFSDLVEAGGTVLSMGDAPVDLLSEVHDSPDADVHSRWMSHVRAGRVIVVESAHDVAECVGRLPRTFDVDAPFLHRLVDGVDVILAIAHDESTGTRQPIVDGLHEDWPRGGPEFAWADYWGQLLSRGYEFRAVGDRTLTVTVARPLGPEDRAQLWDPFTGETYDLPIRWAGGVAYVDADFRFGPIAVIAIGSDLSSASGVLPGVVRLEVDFPPSWAAVAESTLSNAWADLAPGSDGEVIPIQVWDFDHIVDEGSTPGRAVATFGPFGEISVGDGPWADAVWSLSRGIRNDPLHFRTLGPSGYVPEEVVQWSAVTSGDRCHFRTHVTVQDGDRWLYLGGNGRVRAWFADQELELERHGYVSLALLPSARDSSTELRVEVVAIQDGDVRLAFAVTSDPVAMLRPEWIAPAADVAPTPGGRVDFSVQFELAAIPDDGRVQVGTAAPAKVYLNETLVGQQGGFDPFEEAAMPRILGYDVTGCLRVGVNSLRIECVTGGHPPTLRVDSVGRADGGLGIFSDETWSCRVGEAEGPVRASPVQIGDPRYGSLAERPHPLAAVLLPGHAATVDPLIPDVRPGPPRTEALRFRAPLGLRRFRIPTELRFAVSVSSREVDGWVTLNEEVAAGSPIVVTFDVSDGRRAGALLDGPIEVEVGPTTTSLDPWAELGLGSLAGRVRYRTPLTVPPFVEGERVVLDLGQVRGSVAVLLDGRRCATLVTGPWRVDITDRVTSGLTVDLEVVVSGTLAPYLEFASPTSAVFPGQTVYGLFGPVKLRVHAARDSQ